MASFGDGQRIPALTKDWGTCEASKLGTGRDKMSIGMRVKPRITSKTYEI